MNQDLIDELIEIRNERNPEWAVDQLLELLIQQMAKEEDHKINLKLLLEVIDKNMALNQQLKSQLLEIERLSVLDPLTKLYNRKKVTEDIRVQLQQFDRYQRPFSLMMFDIDHFKHVNDTYGHNVGDEVLQKVAEICQKEIRSVDLAARWGGEEFIILLGDTSIMGAYKAAEKLRSIIEASEFPHGEPLTCSFGVSTILSGDTLETLIDRADQGLYEAKRSGRNRVCPQIGTAGLA